MKETEYQTADDRSVKPRRQVGLFKFLLRIAIGLTLVFALFILFEHVRGKRAYRALLAEMQAAGEETDVWKIAPAKPDDSENIAVHLHDLYQSLSDLEDKRGGSGPSMKLTSPGVATPEWMIDSWEQTISSEDESSSEDITTNWDEVRTNLFTSSINVETIEEILALPRFHSGVDYEDFTTMDPFFLVSAKQCGVFLKRHVELALREGRTADAVIYLTSMLRLIQSIEDEPLLITQLVRQAIGWISFNVTWDALASRMLSAEQCKELIEAWRANDFIAPIRLAMRVERATNIAYIEKLRRSGDARRKAFNDTEEYGGFLNYGSQLPTSGWILMHVHLPLWHAAWLDQDATRALDIWRETIHKTDLAFERSIGALGPDFTLVPRAVSFRTVGF